MTRQLRMIVLVATMLVVVLSMAAMVEAAAPDWEPAPAPPGLVDSGAAWGSLRGPGAYRFRAAVLRPAGSGPFPTLIVLHGSSGLSPVVVEVGARFRDAGFLVVVPCWFAAPGAPPRLVDCSQAPPEDLAAARALVEAIGTIPGVQPGRLGVYGMSTGGGVAALLASTGGDLRAVIVDGAPLVSLKYNALKSVRDLSTPLLILHGENDTQVSVKQAREYERAAVDAGKLVESAYFVGVGHVVSLPSQSLPELRDAVQRRALDRSVTFLRQHLGQAGSSPAALPGVLPSAGDAPVPPSPPGAMVVLGLVLVALGLVVARGASSRA